MKRTCLPIALLLSAVVASPSLAQDKMDIAAGSLQTADEATIIIEEEASKGVKFTADFQLFGKDDDDDDRRRSSGRNLGTDRLFNIDLGMNNYLENGSFPNDNNADYAVKPWGSWYVGLNNIYNTHIGGKFFLDWGGGVSWYNFKYEDPSIRVSETLTLPGMVDFDPLIDPTIDPIKSKLTATYINFMVVPMIDFSYKTGKVDNEDETGNVVSRRWIRKTHDGFRFGVGPYVGYRIDSYTKVVFEDEGGDKDKDRDKDNFYLNNFRYGLRAQIGFDDVDLFFQYDMNELFSEGRGPQLNALSFGFIL